MAQTIQLKRGLNANLSSLTLQAGEPAFTTDTGKLYIGDGTNNILINSDIANVATADKLTNARTISSSGDATGSTTFDGSSNVSMALTLANTGVTTGTYTKFTVDAKGRITNGTTLLATDIPILTLSKISDVGTVASKNTGTASGNIPVLDSNGKLDTNVLPSLTINNTYVVSTQIAMLALSANVGDVAVRTDLSKSFILKISGASTLANWQELLTPTDVVQSVAGKTGSVTLTSSDVGLGNVTNESKATMFTNPTFTGTATASISGNAGTSTKLATARTIAISGDVNGSATSFDGSANIIISATISTIDGGVF
jgi:hypothetical protein